MLASGLHAHDLSAEVTTFTQTICLPGVHSLLFYKEDPLLNGDQSAVYLA